MRFFIILFALLIISSCSSKKEDIRINQLGYYPKSIKRFTVVNSKSDRFKIKDSEDNIIFEGNLSESEYWEPSAENLQTGYFSELEDTGTYNIYVEGKGSSHPFKIKEHLYFQALKASMKSFYFLRASTELPVEYAGKFKRPAGHPDTLCYFHPSMEKEEGSMSSPKGWYDAGDYNKYVVNAGVTIGTLLLLYELYPDILPDKSLNIPESGNEIPDILDEIKFEIDWLLTMQDEDGGVFFKITSKSFCGMIMPHEDTLSRFVVGKSTTSTLEFAAITAHFARVYTPFDPEFAKICLEKAEKAWKWAKKNDNIIYENPPDVRTGTYSNKNMVNDFLYAASELLATTGEKDYLDYILRNPLEPGMFKGASWADYIVDLGIYSLINEASNFPGENKTELKESILKIADDISTDLNSISYPVTIEKFGWGSNSNILNSAVICAMAFHYTKEIKYLNSVVVITDYIFGNNATSYSFVTGFGDKTPMNIHHRPSEADKIAEPIPGYVVGGPNHDRQDSKNKMPWGVIYPDTNPAKCYVDEMASFASNEICINWNAPLVFILGFLEANKNYLSNLNRN
jgi:endoglucanase